MTRLKLFLFNFNLNLPYLYILPGQIFSPTYWVRKEDTCPWRMSSYPSCRNLAHTFHTCQTFRCIRCQAHNALQILCLCDYKTQAGLFSTVGIKSSLAFWSFHAQFPSQANVLLIRLLMKYFLWPFLPTVILVGQLSVTGKRMCTEYRLTLLLSLPRKSEDRITHRHDLSCLLWA